MAEPAGARPRYVTPEALLQLRFGSAPRPEWDVAIICFRGAGGSEAVVKSLGARPVAGKALYGIEPSRDRPLVHEASLGRHRLVVVSECIWGAPQAAILVEELAALGARAVLGFGVAGALVAELPKGTQIVATAAAATDGTSPAYTAALEVAADVDLATALGAAAARIGVPLAPVTVATVDALYRETPADVRRWLGRGAGAVNMETAPLYAAAAACGVRSLWLGHISDALLDRGAWDSWQRPAVFTDVTVALLAALLGDLADRSL